MPIRLLLLFVTFLSVADRASGQQSIKPKVVQRGKKATALVLNQEGEGVGTAFCVDARGYFVTNSHVVNEADSSYSLLLHSSEDDAQQVEATVVRRSRDSDLALLLAKDAKRLTPLTLSSAKELVETSTVVAFGFPYGNDLANEEGEFPAITINVARITALRKSKGTLERIQFDSQLNPGNSGGPVLNTNGDVIGVAQAIVLGVTEVGVVNAGINVAIPSAKVEALLRQPLITVHRASVPTFEQPLEIDFSIKEFESFRLAHPKVSVAVHVNGKQTETELEPADDSRYRLSLPITEERPKKAPPTATVQFTDGSISGVMVNAEEKIGQLGISWEEIASIEKADGGLMVQRLNREQQQLTEFSDVDIKLQLGGKQFSVPLDQLQEMTLDHVRAKPLFAKYEIIVRDDDNIVGRLRGRLGSTAGLEIASEKTDDTPTLYSAESVARGKTLEAVSRLKVASGVTQILPLPGDSLILVRNTGSEINVLDAQTGKVIGTQTARNGFSDMNVSPDGRVVYAADYGGERTGYGEPQKPHYVHRFDVASGKWEVARAPKIALRIEVVDAETFVLQEGDQWINISLNRWPLDGIAVTELSRSRCDYSGDSRYDPFLGRLLHGNSGISRSSVNAYRVGSAGFSQMETGDSSRGYSKLGIALSADGRFFFHNRQQVDARDLKRKLKEFPNLVLAATADLALTAAEICDIETAEVLRRWDYEVGAIGVSLAGEVVIVHDKDQDELVIYQVRP